MRIDLDRFGSPWEHIRLLSDGARNQAMVAMLERLAPGNRVLEVGCGTGLLACVAARLGATRVYAVEPTPIIAHARELVAESGLSDVVEVLEGKVEDLWAREVDVAFSELLNADPFVEGVLPAMAAAKRWVVPGGIVSPRRLKVWVAAIRYADVAREVREAREEVRKLADRFGLATERLDHVIADPGIYPLIGTVSEIATEPVLAWDLEVGTDLRPTETLELTLTVTEPGPIGGVMAWFEADLCDGVTLANPPGFGGHWGHHVCALPEEIGARAGAGIRVQVYADDEGLALVPQ